jgi:glycosyltransferase involved in cell wall biosynthesis
MSDLTIAIPTYDRNVILRDNLARLLPQLTDDCRLLIIDNASPTAVSETLEPLLKSFPRVRAEVVRNRVNLGGSANILRCFELCQTEWLWLLGDDDGVHPNALSTILTRVARDPDCVFFNFSSPCFTRLKSFLTEGTAQLIEQMDSFSGLLFMSAGVYKTSALLPFLKHGYHYAYACAPNVAALLACLGDHARCLFSEETIIQQYRQAPATQSWSPITALIGRMTLLDLPLDPKLRILLARKLAAKPSLEYIVVSLVLMACNRSFSSEALYLYDHICYRLYYFDRTIFRRLRIRAYRCLVRFPRVGRFLLNVAFKLLSNTKLVQRNPLGAIAVQDRFARI